MHPYVKAFALASLVFVACSKQEQQQPAPSPDSAKLAAAPVKEGQGRGVIKEMDSTKKSAVIDHNNIPGIMDAMAMNYKVDHPELLSGIKAGDSIQFTLQDRGEGNFVVTSITPIKK
jgi:Cu/Ag efflux protein CusF